MQEVVNNSTLQLGVAGWFEGQRWVNGVIVRLPIGPLPHKVVGYFEIGIRVFGLFGLCCIRRFYVQQHH